MKKLKQLMRRWLSHDEPVGRLWVEAGNTVVVVGADGVKRPLEKAYPGVEITCAGYGNMIELAEGIPFSESRLTVVGNNHTLRIGATRRMVKGLLIDTWGSQGAKITLGRDFQCAGFSAYITQNNPVLSIGDGCLFAWGIKLWMGHAHAVVDVKTGRADEPTQTFRIGDRVWVGYGSLFTKNIEIADGCIVAAGSVVTKSVERPNCMVGGNPAVLKKQDVTWFYPMAEWYNAIVDGEVNHAKLGFWKELVEATHRDEVRTFAKTLQPTPKKTGQKR
jgi:acetyltransferase-like isoleucine patch superfamily enzyme